MRDDEIKIENLNVYQKHLLDKIWACKTEDELKDWLGTLPNTVLMDAVVLVRVLELEILDQQIDADDDDLSEISEYLKKFML